MDFWRIYWDPRFFGNSMVLNISPGLHCDRSSPRSFLWNRCVFTKFSMKNLIFRRLWKNFSPSNVLRKNYSRKILVSHTIYYKKLGFPVIFLYKTWVSTQFSLKILIFLQVFAIFSLEALVLHRSDNLVFHNCAMSEF